MEGLRLRLVFEDRQLLSKSQRIEGLKRSWILLKPHHDTISDLSAHLLQVFDLDEASPHGLLLSMEGFVLPPFESTSILKENDVIRVKKKKDPSTDVIRVHDERKSFELEEVVEKQPVNAGLKLLANEEFELESGGYQSDSEEGEPDKLEDKLDVDDSPEKKSVSKKRKASKKLQRSNDRRKRKKVTTVVDVENDVQPEQNKSSHQHPDKSPVKNDMSSDTHSEPESSSRPKIDERIDNVNLSTPSKPSSSKLQENGKKSVTSSHTSGGVEKIPSRSTRRKKAKRKRLREQVKAKQNELHKAQLLKTDNQQSSIWQLTTDNQQSSIKDNSKVSEDHQQDKCDDEEDNIVPVVVRPGHIRFEPFGKDADQATQQHEFSTVTFQWNGITSKKKGQKWGKEKTVFQKRNDGKKVNSESSDMLVDEEETPTVNVPVDFDKLKPCTTLPQIGDKVAYRLVELSASWTPELSSFQVGKVSNYDPKSDKITLVQVPEYPIVFEERDEESAPQPNASLYREDGSLEIDYSSLADVRIIKYENGNLNTAKSVTNGDTPKSVSNWDKAKSVTNGDTAKSVTNGDTAKSATNWDKAKSVANGVCQASSSKPNSNEETKTPAQENGKDVWDEICEAFSAKKAQLSQEDNWNKKKSTAGSSAGSSSRSSWSYRALRGSALGPTMALLRAQKDL